MRASLAIIDYIEEDLVVKLYTKDLYDLLLAIERRNMVFSAIMRMKSAFFHAESLGNHYREDYLRRDNNKWLA